VCGQSCSPSTADGGRCMVGCGFDWRVRFRGGGRGRDGEGVRGFGGG
jgi:hypothetical protein